MITLLAWLGIILATLLGLILLVPLSLRASGEVDGLEVDGRAVMSWGFGFLSVRIARGGGAFYFCGLRVARFEPDDEDDEKAQEKKRKREEKKQRDKERRKEKKREKGPSRWGIRRLWAARHVFGRLLRTLHIRGWIGGVYGLGDPYETALTAQTLRVLNAVLPFVELDLEADYMDEALELEGELRARVWIIETAVVAVWLLARRDTRRLLMAR